MSNDNKNLFWLAVGNRVMCDYDYRRGTIIDSSEWMTTGEVTVHWDDDSVTVISKFNLEPVYV